MNETRRKPSTGTQCPTLFDKWHGTFYMPSRTDTAGHTKAFDYPVTQTRLDIPRPLITQSWTTGGKSKCSGTSQILTADLSVHSLTRQPPDHDDRPTSEGQLYPGCSSRGRGDLLKQSRTWNMFVYKMFATCLWLSYKGITVKLV